MKVEFLHPTFLICLCLNVHGFFVFLWYCFNCYSCSAVFIFFQDLSYKDKHWHEKCFKCCDCQNSLVDQPFASKEERLYCADCHDNNFAARCDGCTNIFRAGKIVSVPVLVFLKFATTTKLASTRKAYNW